MIDIEADGPIPGDYSMISFGAVLVEPALDRMFYGELKPISDKFIPEAIAVSTFTREHTLTFRDPKEVMSEFEEWIKATTRGKPVFVSDNNGFDWMFVAFYMHHFLGRNVFGHSSVNLGSLYKGMIKTMRRDFKHLRKTKHTHNPVDDAKGNAEAFIYMVDKMGLKI